MLRTSIKYGLHTDLIDDAQANALLSRNRVNEAVKIWQSLLKSDNQTVKDSAQKKLKIHLKDALQQDIFEKVDSLLKNSFNNENAIKNATDLLTDAFLQDPTNENIYKRFQEIGERLASTEESNNPNFQELASQRKTLAGLEVFIISLEKRRHALLKTPSLIANKKKQLLQPVSEHEITDKINT